MRTAIFAPMLLLAACNVSQDDGNGTTTVSFDHNAAENTLDTVGDHAQNIGGAIVNDVQETAGKVDNRVDIDIDTRANDGNSAN